MRRTIGAIQGALAIAALGAYGLHWLVGLPVEPNDVAGGAYIVGFALEGWLNLRSSRETATH